MVEFWIVVFIQAFIIGLFCSFIAKERGRDTESWFLLGFLFSFIALLALIVIPIKEKQVGSGNSHTPKVVCPFCREEVREDAILCKHCRSDLSEMKPIKAQTLLRKTSQFSNTPILEIPPDIRPVSQEQVQNIMIRVNEKSSSEVFRFNCGYILSIVGVFILLTLLVDFFATEGSGSITQFTISERVIAFILSIIGGTLCFVGSSNRIRK